MTFAVSELASRPVQTAAAMRMAFVILGATVALAGAKAFTARSVAAPILPSAPVAPIAESVALADAEATQDICRRVVVEIDEGYGVRGHVTRWICRKAF